MPSCVCVNKCGHAHVNNDKEGVGITLYLFSLYSNVTIMSCISGHEVTAVQLYEIYSTSIPFSS